MFRNVSAWRSHLFGVPFHCYDYGTLAGFSSHRWFNGVSISDDPPTPREIVVLNGVWTFRALNLTLFLWKRVFLVSQIDVQNLRQWGVFLDPLTLSFSPVFCILYLTLKDLGSILGESSYLTTLTFTCNILGKLL